MIKSRFGKKYISGALPKYRYKVREAGLPYITLAIKKYLFLLRIRSVNMTYEDLVQEATLGWLHFTAYSESRVLTQYQGRGGGNLGKTDHSRIKDLVVRVCSSHFHTNWVEYSKYKGRRVSLVSFEELQEFLNE